MIVAHDGSKQRMHDECVPHWLIIGKPISQYALYTAVFCPLNSSISIEKHEKHL